MSDWFHQVPFHTTSRCTSIEMISFCCTITVTIVLLSTCETTTGVPDTTLHGIECNTETIKAPAYEEAVKYTLKQLISATWNRGRNYYTRFTVDGFYCFGHARCSANAAFTLRDCKVCLRSARHTVNDMCHFVKGAHITLADCYMRFEDYNFIEG